MTKWNRRDSKKRRRMAVDGRNIGTVYAFAIAKNAAKVKKGA